jgi:hypothetical protein
VLRVLRWTWPQVLVGRVAGNVFARHLQARQQGR